MRNRTPRRSDSEFAPTRPSTCKWQANGNAPLGDAQRNALMRRDVDRTAHSCLPASRPGHGRQAPVHPQQHAVHCRCERQKVKSTGQGARAFLSLDLDTASKRQCTTATHSTVWLREAGLRIDQTTRSCPPTMPSGQGRQAPVHP